MSWNCVITFIKFCDISSSFLFSSINALVWCLSFFTIPNTGIFKLYFSIALLVALICVIPPSANIASGNSPNPPLGFSIECFNLLVITSSMHLGSSCSYTVFILKRLDKFFFIAPSFNTHIPATIYSPDMLEISYVSIFLGNLSNLHTSFISNNISLLSFSLFSSVTFALFSAISTKRSFSPFLGVFISTFFPKIVDNHCSTASLSSISSLIIILFGMFGLSI